MRKHTNAMRVHCIHVQRELRSSPAKLHQPFHLQNFEAHSVFILAHSRRCSCYYSSAVKVTVELIVLPVGTKIKICIK